MASYARGRDALRVGGLAAAAVIVFSFLFLQMTSRGLSLRQSDVNVLVASAGGLARGDPVVFRGVAVGRVRRLEFLPSGQVLVKAHLVESVPLTRDATAELVPIDMFGRQSLVLRDGTDRLPPLRNGDTIPGLVPPSMPGRISDLGERAGSLMSDTTVLLLQGALLGAGAAGREVAALSARLDTVIGAQQQALAVLLEQTTGLARNLNAASDPQALEALRLELMSAVSALTRLTERLDTATVGASAVLGALQGEEGTAGLVLNDPELYRRTNELLASVDALVRDLKVNPKRYISVSVF